MIRTGCLLVGVWIIGGLTGCGSNVESRLSSIDVLKSPPLMTFFGGNASCRHDPISGAEQSPRGAGAWVDFQRILDGAARVWKRPVPWVASCHDTMGGLVFLTSDDTETRYAEYSEVVDAVEASAAAHDAHHVVLWGHSYGGWQAMNAALELDRGLTVDLFSVDPISRINCTYTNWGGCTSAPSDFTATQLRDLKERTEFWSHYFQTHTMFLHSSDLPDADERLEIDVSHFMIDIHAWVWERVQSRMDSFH